MKVVPANILKCMGYKDRKSLGKAGLTPDECAEIAVAKSEMELQGQLYSLLYRRGHRPRMQPTRKRSQIAPGMPDIAFEIHGLSVHWEVKLPGKNPTPQQYKCHRELAAAPNGAIVRVIRSYREGLDHLAELEDSTLTVTATLAQQLAAARELFSKIRDPFCRMTRGQVCEEINQVLADTDGKKTLAISGRTCK